MGMKLLRLSKELVIYLFIAIVIALVVDWYRSKDMPTESAPPFAATLMNGEQVDVIAQSYESPVIVYFWATWCAACKFVSPTVDWISQYYPVVAVSGSSGPNERVSHFLAQKGYGFANINDLGGDLFRKWGISVTPTIAIIKDGQVETITTGITTPPGLLVRTWLNQ
ncbi:protein disulfide oxidoreductase [Vibrio atypicus]|uniref:protein disulfide oxidoreductase n=1 Tax=Vibrio atypicus TaxID=558271 RepID=UPI00373686AF